MATCFHVLFNPIVPPKYERHHHEYSSCDFDCKRSLLRLHAKISNDDAGGASPASGGSAGEGEQAGTLEVEADQHDPARQAFAVGLANEFRGNSCLAVPCHGVVK